MHRPSWLRWIWTGNEGNETIVLVVVADHSTAFQFALK
jgi:hypothetical protein